MKKFLKIFACLLLLGTLVFLLYCNNTRLVDKRTVACYNRLKDTLRQLHYSDDLLVVSTKRFQWHNQLQVWYSGAAGKSRHLEAEAIDFVVFDLNRDGCSDSLDVNIAYNLLDKNIIRSGGGLGTYEHESSFIDRQMIHIDCRGFKARWAR